MKKILFLFLALHLAGFGFAQVKVEHLLTENQTDPLSIDALTPRFSWQITEANKRGIMQSAYEIKVKKGNHSVWSSGKVLSDQSMYVPYKGETLASGQKYSWQERSIQKH